MYRALSRGALALGVLGIAAITIGADKQVATTSAAGIHHCRVSRIEDMKVQNAAHEDIGKIKDMVINTSTGKVDYVALEFGGFLGVGEKLFAVPWTAFKAETPDAQKPHEHVLVLNVSKDRLKTAPGFDKEHWPDMANPNWSRDVDRYYTPEGNAAIQR